jgi:hypothetical protein
MTPSGGRWPSWGPAIGASLPRPSPGARARAAGSGGWCGATTEATESRRWSARAPERRTRVLLGRLGWAQRAAWGRRGAARDDSIRFCCRCWDRGQRRGLCDWEAAGDAQGGVGPLPPGSCCPAAALAAGGRYCSSNHPGRRDLDACPGAWLACVRACCWLQAPQHLPACLPAWLTGHTTAQHNQAGVWCVTRARCLSWAVLWGAPRVARGRAVVEAGMHRGGGVPARVVRGAWSACVRGVCCWPHTPQQLPASRPAGLLGHTSRSAITPAAGRHQRAVWPGCAGRVAAAGGRAGGSWGCASCCQRAGWRACLQCVSRRGACAGARSSQLHSLRRHSPPRGGGGG